MTTTLKDGAVVQHIFLNVSGVNGETGKSKAVAAKFTGEGVFLNGGVDPMPEAPRLKVPGTEELPAILEFDRARYQSLLQEGESQEAAQMLADFNSEVQQQSASGNDFFVELRRAMVDYLCANEGFHREDGSWYVITEQDVDIHINPLSPAPDGTKRVQLVGAIASKFGAQV